jgi:hypothetical protein
MVKAKTSVKPTVKATRKVNARLIEDDSLDQYVDLVRAGKADPYVAYRVFTHHWKVQDKAVLRAAAQQVFAHDPRVLLERLVPPLLRFSDEELAEIASSLNLEDASLLAYARGALYGSAIAERRDAARARQALLYLEAVAEQHRREQYHALVARCERWVSVERALEAHIRQLELAQPGHQAHPLGYVLRDAVLLERWEVYDKYRRLWDELPKKAYKCEHQTNELFNFDGLRDLARDQLKNIPGLLQKAVDVKGCPHLNSFGCELGLVKKLIDRKLFPTECRAYLKAAEKFAKNDAIAKLLALLESPKSPVSSVSSVSIDSSTSKSGSGKSRTEKPPVEKTPKKKPSAKRR